MVDAVSYTSSAASSFAQASRQSVQSSREEAREPVASSRNDRDDRSTGGVQARATQAVQPSAQNGNQGGTATRNYSGNSDSASAAATARPAAATGRGQLVDVFA